MTSTQHARGHPALHQRGQLQQAQRVGDLRTRSAYPGGQLIMGAAEVVQQLLICRRLFKSVELAAVQVLQEGVA